MIGPPGSMTRWASRRARNSPEPATTAAVGPADRRPRGPFGRERQAIEQAFVGGAGESECILLRKAVAVGADHPGQAVAGRLDRGGPAVGRRQIARVGCDISQREVDVERRGKDLGGQSGGDPAQRQLGRQCADRRSAHARINQLAGLEALGVASPRAATRPRSSGIRSVVVVPMSIKRPRDSGIDRAARFASASQFAAAASCGCRRASATE